MTGTIPVPTRNTPSAARLPPAMESRPMVEWSAEQLAQRAFDLNLLDKRLGNLLDRRCDGLDFVYPGCPRYRDDLTAQLIKNHLEMLSRGVD